MMKKLAAMLMAATLCTSTAAIAEEAEDVPDLAGTYYSYGYDVGTMFMDYYFHFYDEIPGMGKVFYGGMCMNQITFNGTYEVLAEECEYACWPDRETVQAAAEGTEPPTGTAPYTIVFYDFDGNELDRCAMDEEHIYNDMENITGVGGENATLNLDTDPENSRFAADYENEQALAILDLINPEDDTATLTLKVNGKYDDLVIFYVEGTFSIEETDEGRVITLTPDDEEEDGAVVTQNEDGTYTYVSDSGDEVILEEVKGLEVSYCLRGEIPVPGMDDTMADLICDLYDDETVRLYADFMGNQMDIDQGTYEIDMETYSFILHFENAGDLTTEGYADQMVLNYEGSADPFGDIAQTLAFVTEDAEEETETEAE